VGDRGCGLDVACDADAYQAVRAAFEPHSLLVFRDQTIADDIQVAYSRACGPLELTKVASLGAGGFYSKLTNRGQNGEPEEGGETDFTSTRLPWERLPSDMQSRVKDGLATHPREPRPRSMPRHNPENEGTAGAAENRTKSKYRNVPRFIRKPELSGRDSAELAAYACSRRQIFIEVRRKARCLHVCDDFIDLVVNAMKPHRGVVPYGEGRARISITRLAYGPWVAIGFRAGRPDSLHVSVTGDEYFAVTVCEVLRRNNFDIFVDWVVPASVHHR
jgi:hypothetical protein